LAPNCHAYFEQGKANPYHWMLHEATHQLNNELAHFKLEKWIDEGLASYFGTSQIRNGKLFPGAVDKNPIWWLAGLKLSGNVQLDIDAGKIIPLSALISGVRGPTIADNVNLYYIEYWSLSHFLFHYESGRYAASYRNLIHNSGSLADFEKQLGPVVGIQRQWYDYLRQRIADTGR
jgi:hypothetical protein